MSAPWPLLLTCEHASRKIPPSFAEGFRSQEAKQALRTHEAWDPGAALLFDTLTPLARHALRGSWSRLLIELNRSPHHPKLFSRFTKPMIKARKHELLRHIYEPYRNAVATAAQDLLQREGRLIHLSVHTFTPHLNGKERRCDVGLLYDPGRPGERAFTHMLAGHLLTADARLHVRRNYPYRGVSDGLVTTLRQALPHAAYLGIELEVNQKFFPGARFTSNAQNLAQHLAEGVRHCLDKLIIDEPYPTD